MVNKQIILASLICDDTPRIRLLLAYPLPANLRQGYEAERLKSLVSIGASQRSAACSVFLYASSLILLLGSSVISRISLGHLSDILNPWTLTTLTLAATSVSTFVLWGALSTSVATISTYAVLFGALAGGFSSLWTGFVRPIASQSIERFGLLVH